MILTQCTTSDRRKLTWRPGEPSANTSGSCVHLSLFDFLKGK
jgi:hypothetical protein